jgi:hypothetical protein
MKGGQRFRFVAKERRFDKSPEVRTLLAFGVGAGALALANRRRRH